MNVISKNLNQRIGLEFECEFELNWLAGKLNWNDIKRNRVHQWPDISIYFHLFFP